MRLQFAIGALAAALGLLLHTPAAAQGWETYLAEDFDAKEVMFRTGEFGEASYTVDNAGRYVMNGMDSSVDSLSALADSAYYYRIETDCQVLSSTAGELAFCGLIFHYKRRSGEEKPSYYVFYIYGDGFYGVKRMLDTRTEVLLPLTRTDLLDPTRPNRLAVEARGSNFDLFINGQQVGNFSDMALDGGGFGFYISKNTIGAFDNFRVSVEPRPAASSSRQPTTAEAGERPRADRSGTYRAPVIPRDPNRPIYPWEVGYDKNVNRKKRRQQEEQRSADQPRSVQRTEDTELRRDRESRSAPSLRQQDGARQAPPLQRSRQVDPERQVRPQAEPEPERRPSSEPPPPGRLRDTDAADSAFSDEPVLLQDEEIVDPASGALIAEDDDVLYRSARPLSNNSQIEDEPVEAAVSPVPSGGAPGREEIIPLSPPALDEDEAAEREAAAAVGAAEVQLPLIPDTPLQPPDADPQFAPDSDDDDADAEAAEDAAPRRRSLDVGNVGWEDLPAVTYNPDRRLPADARAQREREKAEAEERRREQDEREAKERAEREAEVAARRDAGRDRRVADSMQDEPELSEPAPARVNETVPSVEIEQLDLEDAQTLEDETDPDPLLPPARNSREPAFGEPGISEPTDAEADFSLPSSFEFETLPDNDEPDEDSVPAEDEFELPALEDAAGPEQVRVSDDFSDRTLWMQQATDTSSYFYHEDDYRIDNLRAETMAISYQQDSFADVDIAVDAQHLGGLDYVGYGIAGRFNYVGNNVSYYGMFVSHTGEFMLLKVINGRESVLHDWTSTPLLNVGTANRIGLRFDGDRIVALINGQQVASVRDGDIPSGGYALLAGPGVAARYDNLQLTGSRR